MERERDLFRENDDLRALSRDLRDAIVVALKDISGVGCGCSHADRVVDGDDAEGGFNTGDRLLQASVAINQRAEASRIAVSA